MSGLIDIRMELLPESHGKNAAPRRALTGMLVHPRFIFDAVNCFYNTTQTSAAFGMSARHHVYAFQIGGFDDKHRYLSTVFVGVADRMVGQMAANRFCSLEDTMPRECLHLDRVDMRAPMVKYWLVQQAAIKPSVCG